MRVLIASAAVAVGVLLSPPGGSPAAIAATADDLAAPISLPWTARGNEPNWVLSLEAGRMLYRSADGDVEAMLPAPVLQDGVWLYRAAKGDLTVSVQRKICRDTMTGMPSPLNVEVRAAAKVVTGCGGRPADLLVGGEWRVLLIGDEPVPGDVTVSLDFDAVAGQVSGASGCNRYFGAFTLSGEGIHFQPGMAASMMACEEVPTRIERAFLSELAKVQRFDIDAEGMLLLIVADRTTIRARRDSK